ncbi:probable Phosphoserine phosphatase [Phialocephala subalpina]|uniref:Probable Phosphoserine phosphatase n=1 Tax=Phialocephala subalpina TaxID=576137 RepID=A0A1L7XEE2_9HELO|nr:probable Phosphoserine phosphatase [Phialocephala subalpina]
MAASILPAMKTNPKYIFFTDFDGTITQKDSNDYMTDNLGYGQIKRKQGNRDVLDGKMTFRDSFREMLDSVKTPFDECIKILQEAIKLDPYFKEFYEYARQNNIPVVVLSGGMTPIVRGLLVHLLGEEHGNEMQIVSNDVGPRDGKSINEEGGWQIVYHDDTHFGHDKSLEIRPYANLPADQRPTMFYAGDGVSDFSAASETDLLFAKKGHDLITYCLRDGTPFTVFEDWSSILATVKDIVAGKTTVQEVSAAGAKEAKANGIVANGRA